MTSGTARDRAKRSQQFARQLARNRDTCCAYRDWARLRHRWPCRSQLLAPFQHRAQIGRRAHAGRPRRHDVSRRIPPSTLSGIAPLLTESSIEELADLAATVREGAHRNMLHQLDPGVGQGTTGDIGARRQSSPTGKTHHTRASHGSATIHPMAASAMNGANAISVWRPGAAVPSRSRSVTRS